MALKVIKEVTGSEPINLIDVKNWLRVTYSGDDTLITNLITQSRELVETYINQSIILTTIELWATPRTTLTLPYGPVIDISGVTTTGGTESIEYTYNGFEITFEPSQFSPTAPEAPQYVETITTYTAGWTTIPKGLELVLYEIISFLYENRGDMSAINNLLYQNKYLQQYRNKIWI